MLTILHLLLFFRSLLNPERGVQHLDRSFARLHLAVPLEKSSRCLVGIPHFMELKVYHLADRYAVLPSEAAQYSAIIDGILASGDLDTISAKQIRKGLQAAIGHDLSEKKVCILSFVSLLPSMTYLMGLSPHRTQFKGSSSLVSTMPPTSAISPHPPPKFAPPHPPRTATTLSRKKSK